MLFTIPYPRDLGARGDVNEPKDPEAERVVTRVLELVEIDLRLGIKRGFFETRIRGEQVSRGGRCRITVTSSRSELFYVGVEDVKG
jgi:hypothetical protein